MRTFTPIEPHGVHRRPPADPKTSALPKMTVGATATGAMPPFMWLWIGAGVLGAGYLGYYWWKARG